MSHDTSSLRSHRLKSPPSYPISATQIDELYEAVCVFECDMTNLAWRVAIVKFALGRFKSVHRVVAL
jgi:hypothetical protein